LKSNDLYYESNSDDSYIESDSVVLENFYFDNKVKFLGAIYCGEDKKCSYDNSILLKANFYSKSDVVIDDFIKIGTKFIPNVGSISSWGWPTKSGYTISSYYGYRLSVFGEGNFHSGLDIAGTGYGSPVRASNNGVIEEMKVYRDKRGNYTSYGISVLINHNNGYFSLYGHMSGYASGLREGATVSRGQVIGYVGSTGWATGPHLHYEIRTCPGYSCITNPLKFYR